MPKDHDYFPRAANFYGFDPKLDEALFVAVPGEILPLGSGAALWRSDDGARTELLAPPEATVMMVCRTFGRRDEQIELLARTTGQPIDAVAGAIDTAIARGLLAKPTDFLGAERATEPAAPPPLVVLEAGPGLPMLLDSLVRHDTRVGTRRFAVCGPWADGAADAAWRAASTDFARATGADVACVGADEARALTGSWLAGIDGDARDAMLALLSHDVVGPRAATWNWALLLGAGGTIALLGDGSLFPVRVGVGWDARLELFDSPAAEGRFFDDDDALDGLHAYEGDPLGFALRYVGQPARALVRAGDSRFLELWGAAAGEASHVSANARVVGAIAGLWGELDLGARVLLELADRGSLRDLWREPWRTDRLDGARLWHGVRNPRLLSRGAHRPLVLDNRQAMGFAPGPSGTGADPAMLALQRALAPGSRFVYLPMLLGHRTTSPDPVTQPEADAGLAVALILEGFADTLHASDPSARLRALGALSAEYAGAPADELSDLVLRIQLAALCDRSRRLTDVLERHPEAPATWREHMVRAIAETQGTLATASVGPGMVATVRAALSRIARAGVAWPGVWSRARDGRTGR